MLRADEVDGRRELVELVWWFVLHLCAPYVASVVLGWLIPSGGVGALVTDGQVEMFVLNMACYSSWAAWAVLPFARSKRTKAFFRAMVFVPIPFYSFVVWACLSPVSSNVLTLLLLAPPMLYAASKLSAPFVSSGSSPRRKHGEYKHLFLGSAFLLCVFAVLGLVMGVLGIVAISLGSTWHALLAFFLMTVALPGGLSWRVSSRQVR